MKTLSYILLFFALTSCMSTAQSIVGNGTLKKETRAADGFAGVVSDGPFDVAIAYGEPNGVTVEADENLLPYIETVVEENILVIRVKEGRSLKAKNKITLTLSATKLNTLALNGSGNIKASGNFRNDGTTDLAIGGSGNLHVSFESFGSLNAAVNGSGDMMLSGKARDLSAAINGSGNIEAYGVTVDNANVAINGSGNVNITANGSINATISGSGNVNYKGSATDINESSPGSGKVRKS